MDQYPEPVLQSSSSEKKIALFRSLLRGRDEVERAALIGINKDRIAANTEVPVAVDVLPKS